MPAVTAVDDDHGLADRALVGERDHVSHGDALVVRRGVGRDQVAAQVVLAAVPREVEQRHLTGLAEQLHHRLPQPRPVDDIRRPRHPAHVEVLRPVVMAFEQAGDGVGVRHAPRQGPPGVLVDAHHQRPPHDPFLDRAEAAGAAAD
jgi:hypothetical protein